MAEESYVEKMCKRDRLLGEKVLMMVSLIDEGSPLDRLQEQVAEVLLTLRIHKPAPMGKPELVISEEEKMKLHEQMIREVKGQDTYKLVRYLKEIVKSIQSSIEAPT